MRKLLTMLLLFSAASASATVTVRAKLTDGTGTISKTAFLRFQLENCGPNIPSDPTTNQAVIQTQFDLRPNQPDGSILYTNILSNDEILCGGVASTYWVITPMKDQAHPMRDGLSYRLQNGTTFDPSTAAVMSTQPAAPPQAPLCCNSPLIQGTFSGGGGGGGGGGNGLSVNCTTLNSVLYWFNGVLCDGKFQTDGHGNFIANSGTYGDPSQAGYMILNAGPTPGVTPTNGFGLFAQTTMLPVIWYAPSTLGTTAGYDVCIQNTDGATYDVLGYCQPGITNPGGSNTQVQFNNTGSFGGITNAVPGSLLASQGTSTTPVFQTKTYVDVRDGVGGSGGVDCTGATDSTAVLQAMINSASDFTKFVFPEGCKVLVSTSAGSPKAITLQSRTGLEFWFEGHNGNGCGGTGAASIVDNSSYTSGATIFYINQSQRLLFHNVVLNLNGATDIGFDVDQTTSPPTTTANRWENTCVENGVARNANFRGFRFSNTATSNVEAQQIVNSYVQCSNQGLSGQTYSNSGYGVFFGNNNNQKTEIVDGLGTFGCSEDEVFGPGSDFTAQNFLMSQSYSNVLDEAYNSLVMGMRSEDSTHAINVTNPTGPHTYIHNDFAAANGSPIDCTQGSPTTGCGFVTGIGNEADSDIDILNPASSGQNTAGFLVGNRHLIVHQFDWEGGVFNVSAVGFNPILNTFGEYLSAAVEPSAINENMPSAPLVLESAYGSTPSFDTQEIQNVPNGTYGNISNSTIEIGPVSAASVLGGFPNWPGSGITRWLAFPGNLTGINLAQAPQPGTPILDYNGAAGSTCYSYEVVAHGNNGNTQASSAAQTCAAAATLNSSNTIRINIPSVPGATFYDVYRTQCAGVGICSTNPTGIIGQMAAVIVVNGLQSSASGINLIDNGISAGGQSAPSTNTTGNITIAGNVLVSPIAPVIASGFGSTPSIVHSNGTAAFEVNVGTGGSASSGVITMPTATNGWSCQVSDLTTPAKTTTETAFSATSITLTASAAWGSGDNLLINCGGF